MILVNIKSEHVGVKLYVCNVSLMRVPRGFHKVVMEQAIEDFVDYNNHQLYREPLDNLTPEDAYFRRVEEVKRRRELIKERTFQRRRAENLQTVSV